MNKPLVIYHAGCTDGFAAANAAWLKLGDEAEYLPMQYNSAEYNPQDRCFVVGKKCYYIQDREVFVLDFSFGRQLMEELFSIAKRVVWLDHHKTAFEMWGKSIIDGAWYHNDIKTHIHLHPNKSGALLAWEFFHPGTEVPMLIRHIDDRDRWQFKLEGSKELHAALRSRPFDFQAWKRIYFEPGYEESALSYSIREGTAILRAQDAHIKSMLKQARKCELPLFNTADFGEPRHDRNWFRGLALNTPMHMSEVGHELANQSGTYGLVYYLSSDNRVKCSLRSNGDYDVSAIAKACGGGGHRNAAGFEIYIDTLMGWLK